LFASDVTPDTYSRVNQLAYVSRMRSRLAPARLGCNKIGKTRAYEPAAEKPTTLGCHGVDVTGLTVKQFRLTVMTLFRAF